MCPKLGLTTVYCHGPHGPLFLLPTKCCIKYNKLTIRAHPGIATAGTLWSAASFITHLPRTGARISDINRGRFNVFKMAWRLGWEAGGVLKGRNGS